MRVRGRVVWIAALAWGAIVSGAPHPLSAQAGEGEGARVAVSADSLRLGETLELQVTLDVASATVVSFPDRVASPDGVESLGPVEWSAVPMDGGARLTLTYTLIALLPGAASTPAFEVTTRPRAPGGGGDDRPALPGGSLVGPWEAERGAGATRTRVPARPLEVASVLMLADIEQGLEARPPTDVLGASRHWPTFAVGLLALAFLVALGVHGVVRRLGAAPGPALSAPEWTKETALERLEEILAALKAGGPVEELYRRASDVVRHFAERLSPAWSRSLTSTELVRALSTAEAPERDDRLDEAMAVAEAVKFGRRRPPTEQAVSHWRAMADWIGRAR